jgi:hypothetical protein
VKKDRGAPSGARRGVTRRTLQRMSGTSLLGTVVFQFLSNDRPGFGMPDLSGDRARSG